MDIGLTLFIMAISLPVLTVWALYHRSKGGL